MKRDDLDIRSARPDDAEFLAAIYRPEVLDGTSTFEIDPPDAHEMRRRLEAIVAAGYPYLVAEVGGRVAGYAYVTAFRARPAYRFTVENSVYVDRAFRGAGVASRLLQELADAAAARGFRQMMAVIGDSRNQVASLALHRRAGFVEVGRFPGTGHKHGRWLDTVVMQRALGEGDRTPPGA